jgi:hypothetical protein
MQVLENLKQAEHQWLTPIILTTQEAEIGRILVRSQPGQIVHETPILKKILTTQEAEIRRIGAQSQPRKKKKKKSEWSGSRCRP